MNIIYFRNRECQKDVRQFRHLLDKTHRPDEPVSNWTLNVCGGVPILSNSNNPIIFSANFLIF